ncbi:glycosyl hydrolase [Flavobacterium gawalongense]|uniref:Glycosyl hydrolase n=2 Tax=Flavobacterium gawalongense TaxID=2594432 RepID=A0A553BF80_9FLAO|nr:glycosyl hydrolase [Flavobacterium gawalongense]TRX03874.1 glycosyl hydrolase [Flavobacterium gawalongense]TRX06901.1 glycosyl hydrolase [Flavobacterium gawalongense]TRX07630.1 glycosyl hydrolase [Flavobacterium gawalongense]TRX23506.1 glycosyl hydrolase [Flavobacterium gawalongense]
MTLEEKASLCSGETAWSTKAIAKLGIPSIFMTDGPHGLRKAEGFDFTNSVPATCFPTASALASSWNPALAQKMGEALGIESQANDVQILLGPGVNMKRSPLGGRNFEYFSEDPILAGKIATSFINGVQSQGVGTSMKHFAANSQEAERMSNSSNVNERTLNEIYFPAFEMAVKEAQPWTVMCSYNKVNGVYASENPYLLNQILKEKWGFKGFVVSDWGAVNERALGVDAGLHLEMPASGGFNDKKIVEAVKKGTLSEARLDQIVTDLLAVTLKAKDSHKKGVIVDKQKHNDLARQVSGECIVLLKNDNAILPLKSSLKKIAIVGNFAKTPRYQGAGSSQVRPTQILNSLDELKKIAKGTQFSFSTGYNTEGETDEVKIAEAVQNAKNSELVIVFAGLPDSYESEGYDRNNMDLPAGHNKLISAVSEVNKNIIVVLLNGAPVSMPWKNDVTAIVEAYLGGQAGGGAIADVLTGKVNPSGKLSETFPMRLEDTPTAMDFPSKDGNANYGEGIFIGYRYYDKKKIEPNFPFGFGLSYTTFSYSDIKANTTAAKDSDDIAISVKVKNTGKVAGKEVAELYVHEQESEVARPENELKHFEKVALLPGEEKTVTFHLTSRDFAYFNSKSHDWAIKSGKFDIRVGGSSRNLPLQQTIDIQSTKTAKVVLTHESLFKEFKNAPNSAVIYAQLVQSFTGDNKKAETEDEKKAASFLEAMLADMPINKFLLLSGGKFTEENLQDILKAANHN